MIRSSDVPDMISLCLTAFRCSPQSPRPSLYILNRALHTYYARQRTHEQAHLGKLLKKQHESLEEVKRASGWYKTQELLDRYDEGQASVGRTIAQTKGITLALNVGILVSSALDLDPRRDAPI